MKAADDVEFDAFGHWLAGFFDGEGSFGIYTQNRNPSYRCMAKISLRIDDRPILDEIARWTGVGRVYVDKKGAPAHRAPTAAWIVEGKDNCMHLVELFERFPLRAKKRRDFAVWAVAVREWSSMRPRVGEARDWTRMAALADEIRQVRAFEALVAA